MPPLSPRYHFGGRKAANQASSNRTMHNNEHEVVKVRSHPHGAVPYSRDIWQYNISFFLKSFILVDYATSTNPWFQECGPRIMQDGDLIAFDTDLVATYGYCCDISPTWLVGDGQPSDEQKQLYQVAFNHFMINIVLF